PGRGRVAAVAHRGAAWLCIRRTHHARRRGPRHGHGGAAPADQGLNEGGPMTYRTTVLALLAVAACDGAQSLSAPPLAPDRFGRPDCHVPAARYRTSLDYSH